MATIALENMRFYAHHGLYEEEQIIGNHFILDIQIETDISTAKTVVEDGMDKIVATINYETVYDICRIHMEKPQKLLETVIQNIINALKFQFDALYQVRIKVKKLNPPLSGPVASSYVEESYNFMKECPRCKKGFLCYKDDSCWCMDLKNLKVHPQTLATLKNQFKGCLCKNCLKEYAG